MQIDIAIKLWTRSVKMVCNSWSVESFASTVDGTWNAFTYRSCHCGQTDRMLKRGEPSTAATLR